MNTERIDIVTIRELKEMLDKVGIHISETTLRELVKDGTIASRQETLPFHKRPLTVIPAEEVERILALYGKRWPRDPDGNGLLDPVGYLQRKGKPNTIPVDTDK